MLADFFYSAFYFSRDIAEGLTLFDRLTLVALLLSSRDRETELDYPSFIIHRQWDYCQTCFLLCGGKLRELLFRKQEPPVAGRLIAFFCIICLIRWDFCVYEEGLATPHGNVPPLELSAVRAQRLHLGAKKLHPSLKVLEEFIVETRPFVFD